jgi:hypothetical protein
MRDDGVATALSLLRGLGTLLVIGSVRREAPERPHDHETKNVEEQLRSCIGHIRRLATCDVGRVYIG